MILRAIVYHNVSLKTIILFFQPCKHVYYEDESMKLIFIHSYSYKQA